MKYTLFNTPVVSHFFMALAWLCFKLTGWRIVGPTPNHKQCVLIAVPHSTNWDFLVMLATVLIRGMSVRWMGKQALFPPVIGLIMKWLGGIPIDRSQANDKVSQMAGWYQQLPDLNLLITPEGTRSEVRRWKTGFYHIAVNAGVPVVAAFVDYPSRTVGFGPVFNVTGDIEKELPVIQDFYKDKRGLYPREEPKDPS